jgi:hypothetical protein
MSWLIEGYAHACWSHIQTYDKARPPNAITVGLLDVNYLWHLDLRIRTLEGFPVASSLVFDSGVRIVATSGFSILKEPLALLPYEERVSYP